MPTGDEGSSPRATRDHDGREPASSGPSERLVAATRLLATLTAGRARAQAMAERHLDFAALVRVHEAGLGDTGPSAEALATGDAVRRDLDRWRAARDAHPVTGPAPAAAPAPAPPPSQPEPEPEPTPDDGDGDLVPPAGVVSGYLVEPGAPPVHEGAAADADEHADEDVHDEPTAGDAPAPTASVEGPDPESEELYTYRASYEIEEDADEGDGIAAVTIGAAGAQADPEAVTLDEDEGEDQGEEQGEEQGEDHGEDAAPEPDEDVGDHDSIETLSEADGVVSPAWQAAPQQEEEDQDDAVASETTEDPESASQVGAPRTVAPRIMLAAADEDDEPAEDQAAVDVVEEDWGTDHFAGDDEPVDPRDVTGPFTVVDPDDAEVDAAAGEDPEAGPAQVRVGGPEELAAAPASDEFLEDAPVAAAPARGGGLSVSFESADDEWEDEDDGVPRLTDDEPAAPPPLDDELLVQPMEEVDPAQVQAFMDQARDAEERGDLHGAIVFYGDALDLMPDHQAAHIGRGRALMELGDYAAAMSDFQRAEDLNPGAPAPLVEMGHLYFARKEYRRAIEFYDQALELEPAHAMALCRRGMCHHYRRTHRQAFQDLQKAYSLDPEIPNIKKYVQMAVKAMDRSRRR